MHKLQHKKKSYTIEMNELIFKKITIFASKKP